MDIYILDVLLRPIDVVDEYISFLWTERWASFGDFQIITIATPNNKRRFVPDTKLWITQSTRLMIIESVEEEDDIEKGNVLTVKGRCLNSLLEKRIAARHNSITGLISTTWDTYGWTPKELIELYFFTICYDGEISSGDIIPFVQPQGTTSLYPVENIPDPWPDDFEWSTKPESLYQAFQDIISAYDVGWRLYKSPTDSKLYFESMMGCDRTTQQSIFNPVIFSYDMVNLIDTTNLVDVTKYYNAVMVVYFYKDATTELDTTMSVWVESSDLALSERGFDQKTKILSVTQIPEDMILADVPAYLTKLGEEELGRSQSVNVYDGEIAKTSTFVYEKDYNLGDIVEVRGNDGGTAYMRVVEQIFASDSTGDSIYPSLITKSIINPGTWASWKYNVEWSAMGSDEYWSTQ